jgi:hypothetical protein
MRKVIVVILAVLTLVVGMAIPAFAATTADVVITANPAYIVITNAGGNWTLNDIVGDGVTPKGYIAPDTNYYSNPLGDEDAPSDPVVDGECKWTIDPTGSSLHLDLKVNCGAFTGGGAAMANTDGAGENGATTYGGFTYCTGMTYSSGKVVLKSTGSAALKEDLGEATTIKWGAVIETRSNAWAASGASTTTMTITATAHPD